MSTPAFASNNRWIHGITLIGRSILALTFVILGALKAEAFLAGGRDGIFVFGSRLPTSVSIFLITIEVGVGILLVTRYSWRVLPIATLLSLAFAANILTAHFGIFPASPTGGCGCTGRATFLQHYHVAIVTGLLLDCSLLILLQQRYIGPRKAGAIEWSVSDPTPARNAWKQQHRAFSGVMLLAVIAAVFLLFFPRPQGAVMSSLGTLRNFAAMSAKDTATPVRPPVHGSLPALNAEGRSNTSNTLGVSGSVVSVHGIPLNGVQIETKIGKSTYLAKTSADGSWSMNLDSTNFANDVDHCELRFSAVGYASKETRIALPLHEREVLVGRTIMDSAAMLGLEVVDESGAPCSQFHGMIIFEHNSKQVPFMTNASGDTKINTLEHGRVRFLSCTAAYALKQPFIMDLRAGVENQFRLTAKALPDADAIRGSLVGITGEPVRNAHIYYWPDYITQLAQVQETMSNDRGEFSLTGGIRYPMQVFILDRKGARQPTLETIARAPTTHPRIIVNDAVQSTTTVIAPDGRPVTRFKMSLVPSSLPEPASPTNLVHRAGTLEKTPASLAFDSPGGEANVSVMNCDFLMIIEAPFFKKYVQRVRAGEKSDVPKAITLVPSAPVHGTVRCRFANASPARVHARRACAPACEVSMDGFPSSYFPWELGTTKTQTDGQFALDLQSAGQYLIVVDHGCGSRTLNGPVSYDPTKNGSNIEIECIPGGSLHGTVVGNRPDGQQEGSIIAISNGLGDVRSARVDRSRKFKFGGLPPGEWTIRKVQRDVIPSRMLVAASGRNRGSGLVRDLKVTIVSEKDETLDFQCDLEVQLSGTVKVNSQPPVFGYVSLRSVDGGVATPAMLDSLGHFSIVSPVAGALTIEVNVETGRQLSLNFSKPATLSPGLNQVDLHVECAAIHGTLSPAARGEITLVSHESNNVKFECVSSLDPEGKFGFEKVPRGTYDVFWGTRRNKLKHLATVEAIPGSDSNLKLAVEK